MDIIDYKTLIISLHPLFHSSNLNSVKREVFLTKNSDANDKNKKVQLNVVRITKLATTDLLDWV